MRALHSGWLPAPRNRGWSAAHPLVGVNMPLTTQDLEGSRSVNPAHCLLGEIWEMPVKSGAGVFMPSRSGRLVAQGHCAEERGALAWC